MKHFEFKALFAILLALAFSSCASVPMSSPEESAVAKSFKVPATTSRIYVYRNETFGSAVKIPLNLDGKSKGQTAKNVFYAWDVAPGAHTVSCLAESNSEVKVYTLAGKATYIWQEMKMGLWAASCELHEVDPATGQKGVQECNMAQSTAD